MHEGWDFTRACDECGAESKLKFSDGGRTLEQTPTEKRCEQVLFLLRMRNNPKFMLIDRGIAWDGNLSNSVYYYEEHTCPSNVLNCEEVIADGEIDPHGIFEVVAGIPITGPEAMDEEEAAEKLKAIAVELTALNQISHIQGCLLLS